MASFPESPPIIPDGQISRVRLKPWLSSEGLPSLERLTLVRVHPAFWFASASPPELVVALRRFYQAGRHTAK